MSRQVANALAERLGREQVFYDEWYTAELARLNLDTYLQAVYHDGAELIVPFLCADYERKKWCGLEWRAIRDLFEKRTDADIMPLRFDNTAIPGLFRIDGYIDLRQYTPEQTAGFILQRVKPRQQSTAPLIHSDRLPTVKGGFFGRSAELQLLNDAWANTTTRIIQFIAAGGTGKTKLLRHWLDHTADIPVLIAWSFYSQGSSEDKQTSATPFFSHAFEKLGSTRERFASEEDKGEHLAELLYGKRYVLVLDGLEPLQHGGAAMRGELKDKAIRQLLRQLARHPCGLCIITTRIAVHEMSDRDAPVVMRHDLQNLCEVDGVQLLQSLGVTGSATELKKAVREYGGHALALSLLGNVLRLRHQGDVCKRDTLKALVKPSGSKESRHAFKVMQAYAEWFAGEPELVLLHLLGLFDHPIGYPVLQMLWDAQIPHLTVGIDEDEWLDAIAGLREEHHLLSQHDSGGDLDCHPLIREYFGKQLKDKQPQVWQQAHERLYGYYKALPEKELPDTLEEMQPLFSAVAHGCAAGLHQQALDEVYSPRIKRYNDHYLSKSLCAFSEELAIVAHFFESPWNKLAAKFSPITEAILFNFASFSLTALGRLDEAIEAIQKSISISVSHEKWIEAATGASNLSELQLISGQIKTAITSAIKAVNFADTPEIGSFGQRNDSPFLQAYARTILAHAYHQSADFNKADAEFQEAERRQRGWQNNSQPLYSTLGFFHCDLLLSRQLANKAMLNAKISLSIAQENNWPSDIPLHQLTLGRAYLQQGAKSRANKYLNKAEKNLRINGRLEQLASCLLTRAALRRFSGDFARARQDLEEVFDIADSRGMRLHLTDYHLEMARVLLAEMETPPIFPFSVDEQGAKPAQASSLTREGGGWVTIKEHIEKAAKLIAETGYHRRDVELADLKTKIST